MIFVCFFCTYQTCIARRIATIFTIIRIFTCIETLTDRRMSLFITNLCGNSTIKSIQITEPVSIIVLIDVFYDSSLDRVKLSFPQLISENCCLFTTNSSRTIPDDFFSFRCFSIFFQKFWNLTKVDGSCRNCIFKVPKTIFIIISHIEDDIIILFFRFQNRFEFFRRHFFFMFFYFISGNLHSKCDDLVSDFHTHTRKFMIYDSRCFRIYVCDILEVF